MKRLNFLFACLLFFVFSNSYSQDTYKVGNTEYYYGKVYSTTGKAMVKRSDANRAEFLKFQGYDKVPKGYEVDHIKPLSEGGTDDPSNMQLISKERHKVKTANEREYRSNSTMTSLPKYKSNSTYNSVDYSTPSSTNKTIYTGSKGGQYYINSNGNKTYIKSNSSSTYQNNYSSPKTIQTGSRGGQYYINSNGNKTYIKK